MKFVAKQIALVILVGLVTTQYCQSQTTVPFQELRDLLYVMRIDSVQGSMMRTNDPNMVPWVPQGKFGWFIQDQNYFNLFFQDKNNPDKQHDVNFFEKIVLAFVVYDYYAWDIKILQANLHEGSRSIEIVYHAEPLGMAFDEPQTTNLVVLLDQTRKVEKLGARSLKFRMTNIATNGPGIPPMISNEIDAYFPMAYIEPNLDLADRSIAQIIQYPTKPSPEATEVLLVEETDIKPSAMNEELLASNDRKPISIRGDSVYNSMPTDTETQVVRKDINTRTVKGKKTQNDPIEPESSNVQANNPPVVVKEIPKPESSKRQTDDAKEREARLKLEREEADKQRKMEEEKAKLSETVQPEDRLAEGIPNPNALPRPELPGNKSAFRPIHFTEVLGHTPKGYITPVNNIFILIRSKAEWDKYLQKVNSPNLKSTYISEETFRNRYGILISRKGNNLLHFTIDQVEASNDVGRVYFTTVVAEPNLQWKANNSYILLVEKGKYDSMFIYENGLMVTEFQLGAR